MVVWNLKISEMIGINEFDSSPEGLLIFKEHYHWFKYAIYSLPKLHRIAIIHRWGLFGEDPKTLTQIGEIIGKSSARVRQMEINAMMTIYWKRAYRRGIKKPLNVDTFHKKLIDQRTKEEYER